MNGIENITGRILADAQAEIDQINDNARDQVEQINAGYERLARQASDEILTKGEARAQERHERLVSAAKMEARKDILSAKQEVLDEAFALALDQLCGLPENDYVDLLARLAVKASTTGTEQVILNVTDRARYGVRACMKANELLEAAGKTGAITLSEQTRDIRGGLLLASGDVEVNCAFETLVRLERSSMTGEVSKVLFG